MTCKQALMQQLPHATDGEGQPFASLRSPLCGCLRQAVPLLSALPTTRSFVPAPAWPALGRASQSLDRPLFPLHATDGEGPPSLPCKGRFATAPACPFLRRIF